MSLQSLNAARSLEMCFESELGSALASHCVCVCVCACVCVLEHSVGTILCVCVCVRACIGYVGV